MKKLISLLLVLAMIFTLCACAKEEKADKEEEKPTTQESIEEPTSEDETEPTSEEETEPTSEEETEPTSEVEGGIGGLLGIKSGNTYENAAIGLGCELNSDWQILSDEQIAAVIGITADTFNNEMITEMLESSGSAIVFYAVKNDNSTLNIALEDVSMYGDSLTEENYAELVVPMLKSALESGGIQNVVITTETISFMGEDHLALVIEGEVNGVKLYEVQVALFTGNYVASVTVANYGTNNCMEALENFYRLSY